VSSFALIVYIEPTIILISFGLVAFAVLWYLLYARGKVESRGVLGTWILDRSDELRRPPCRRLRRSSRAATTIA